MASIIYFAHDIFIELSQVIDCLRSGRTEIIDPRIVFFWAIQASQCAWFFELSYLILLLLDQVNIFFFNLLLSLLLRNEPLKFLLEVQFVVELFANYMRRNWPWSLAAFSLHKD